MNKIKVGCCGFGMAKDDYFNQFNIVEVQKTFYQPPKRNSTLQRWRNQAPDDFKFTIKAWQLITHKSSSPTYRRLGIDIKNKKNYGSFKPTEEVFNAWKRTKEVAGVLKSKVIVFQCPASFKPTEENKKNMKEFFHSIDRDNFKFVWEPRGDWNKKEIENLCKELNLVHCVDPHKTESVYGNIKYYRLHGRAGYKYKYSNKDLKEIKEKIKQSSQSKSYVMFNNISAIEDAQRFEKVNKN